MKAPFRTSNSPESLEKLNEIHLSKLQAVLGKATPKTSSIQVLKLQAFGWVAAHLPDFVCQVPYFISTVIPFRGLILINEKVLEINV